MIAKEKPGIKISLIALYEHEIAVSVNIFMHLHLQSAFQEVQVALKVHLGL